MKERPILFSAPMVRAILDGRKTQTRRVVKPGPTQKWLTHNTLREVRRFEHRKDDWWAMAVGEPRRIIHCGVEMDCGHIGSVRHPYGEPGDRLWVRETWAPHADDAIQYRPDMQGSVAIYYAADNAMRAPEENGRIRVVEQPFINNWRPSIYMPRWASRITLEITDVRVERLQDITLDDCVAEGVSFPENARSVANFAALWDDINAARGYSWAANPWVWVVSFKRIEQ